MNTRQITALTGLIIALVFVSGCGPSKLQNEPGPGQKYGVKPSREFPIYIYTDPNRAGQCLVDWGQATLWKNQHHTARWVSDDGAAYKVDFNLGSGRGSPFSSTTFDVPANGHVRSGDLTSGAQGYYDYGIKDANGNTCKNSSNPDPGVYVK
jgi:hypothetical protein